MNKTISLQIQAHHHWHHLQFFHCYLHHLQTSPWLTLGRAAWKTLPCGEEIIGPCGLLFQSNHSYCCNECTEAGALQLQASQKFGWWSCSCGDWRGVLPHWIDSCSLLQCWCEVPIFQSWCLRGGRNLLGGPQKSEYQNDHHFHGHSQKDFCLMADPQPWSTLVHRNRWASLWAGHSCQTLQEHTWASSLGYSSCSWKYRICSSQGEQFWQKERWYHWARGYAWNHPSCCHHCYFA